MTPQTPKERYQADLDAGYLIKDSAQACAIDAFEDLYHRLCQIQEARQQDASWIQRVKSMLGKNSDNVECGLYLWGGVGRGKTYLMDVFYDALPFDNKMRTHFHRFMRLVHQKLTEYKGRKNPLEYVADDIAAKTCIICFDEFFVVDITDAMILSNVLQALFARKVALVATSNIEPQGLYKEGLQRERFLPAIDLLIKHTRVMNVDGGTDYRLRALKQAALYYHPLNPNNAEAMRACFERLAADPQSVERNTSITVFERDIPVEAVADDVVWFDFLSVCHGPRSQHDYIELAREFHAVLISDIPVLEAKHDDMARRFIYLVDEFYDRNVKLIILAQAAIDQLYQGQKLKFEFERTQSRLIEMQSEDYLAQPHKA